MPPKVASSQTPSGWYGRTGGPPTCSTKSPLAAKAWSRIGDRRQAEVALDQGRRLLESLPHPDNLDHHFVVDPAKYDFYAMDCYRLLGEDGLAEVYASEILTVGTDATRREQSMIITVAGLSGLYTEL